MKITVQRPCAVLRLFAGLFFLFITFAATAGNPDDWENNAATSIVNAGGGDGESFENPILIANAGELAYFARQVNAGGRELKLGEGESIDKNSTSGKSGFSDYYFALSADIDLEGKNWMPIGNSGSITFRAHFDGKGHKVKGVKIEIERNLAVYAGLFGYVIDGTLQNLGVELADGGIKVTSTGNYAPVFAGGIVGQIQGYSGDATLRNCYVEGKGEIKITGTGSGGSASAGGIVGVASDGSNILTLTNCYATVDVEATASGNCEVGGIAGDVSGTLSYTYATGNVMAKGGTEQYAGGICGIYSGGGELSHNLALNKNVYGDGKGDNIHRIAGYLFNSTFLYSNYANPGVMVNFNAVFASTPDSQDGGNTSLEDFESVLKNAPSDDNAWVFPEGNLPQLRMATDEGKGAPSFADWPAGSQTDYLASKYLNAFIWSDYAATSIANAGGGDGTSFENPILIASAEELAYFARQVNDGGKELTVSNGGSINNSSLPTSGFSGYYFALSDDIDLKGKNWMPIGYRKGTNTAAFRAHFDGKGHKVKGVKVKIESDSQSGAVFAGLFGQVINGTLQNLGVELADGGIVAASTGNDVYAGGIVGQIYGSNGAAIFRNCYVEGAGAIKITGTENGYTASAGGIAGFAEATLLGSSSLTLTNCYATVNVEATASGRCYVGGIAGYVSGTLSYTYATGNVWATGGTEQYAGGICGRYNGGDELSHNLALNKNVYGDGNGDNIHRIASSYSNTSAGLNYLSNYANPGVKVNSNAVFASTPDSQDGGNTSLEDFKSVLRNAPSNDNAWSTAWVFPEGNLPQLRMATDDGKGTPSFADWSVGSQTDYLASNYLNAFIWSDYAATSIANAGGGDGKKIAEPILIASAEELAYFARQVNAGGRELKLDKGESIDNSSLPTSGFSDYYFALSADIDLKGKNWMPIGYSNGITFDAHFDGKGHKVKGVKVKIKSDGTTTDVYAGLFGKVVNGTLQNLGVELATEGIEAASTGRYVYAGGIAGSIQGNDGAATLRNCYVEGAGAIKITGTGSGNSANAGGIVGLASTGSNIITLTNCYATVDVEVTASGRCEVGGIAGDVSGVLLSYTYATGTVTVTGGINQCVGGICGRYDGGGELSHNLALNKSVNGTGDNIHRIAGYFYEPAASTLLSNYAHPAMLLNGSLANSYDAGSQDGADTYRETVREDLAGVSPAAAGWEEAWDWTDGTQSPRLKLVEEATDGSLSYPGTLLAGQLPNDAFGTLAALPLLHLTQATGGTLSVTAGQPATPLNDGDAVRPGTPLTLSYSTGTDYFFEGFFSGTSQGSVDTPLGGSTVEMPRADLWLRASFRYEAPTPPEPVYYTVTLPSVEGVTTDPAAGSHQVESWDNFRFYLTLDAAYDQSVPVVTTDDGKTITPRTSDGAYVLKNVRSDLSVTISGIVKNPPVANEPVASTATRIFTRDGRLFITADRPMQAQVVALTGRLVRSLALTAGTTRIDALSPGIYLVRLDNGTVEKVIVRR